MKITSVDIAKFRGFRNVSFQIGSHLTAIAGQNGTQKSTLLGIITQCFTISKDNPMVDERPLCGGSYRSAFSEKFRLSPIFDKPKEHEWTLHFDSLPDFTIESISRSEKNTIRFWKKGSKQRDEGYLQYPVIFLSMKRLIPIAESHVKEECTTQFSEAELAEIKRLHNLILLTNSNIQSVPLLSAPEKVSLGINTDQYDWNQNSMGQDNVGKIILALLSFKRLKEKYPNDYQGGILAIDELDATMYPASQVRLLKILEQYASDLDLQILFTTHSLSLLKAFDELVNVCKSNPNRVSHTSLIYLRKLDNAIFPEKKADYASIVRNLMVVADKKKATNKIVVYTEDKETICFAKAILKRSRCRYLEFIDATFSSNMLIELSVKRKVPAFQKPRSLIILDGDVKGNKNLKKADNILLLPGEQSPERLIAKYLHELSDASALWNDFGIGYTKQVCFRDYSYEQILSNRESAKKWFNANLDYWGRNAVHVINPMLSDTMDAQRERFLDEFDKIIQSFN